jgi:hypothetical protein
VGNEWQPKRGREEEEKLIWKMDINWVTESKRYIFVSQGENGFV